MINNKKMYFVRWMFKFIPDTSLHGLKARLLRWAGVEVGNNVEVVSSAKILGHKMRLVIGNNCYIGHEALIFGSSGSEIILEDHSKVASRAIIVTGQHRYSTDGDSVAKEGVFANIRICRGALVDTASIVLPGKTVGEMAHVATGSVVTKDVPAFHRVAGIPARVIRDLRE